MKAPISNAKLRRAQWTKIWDEDASLRGRVRSSGGTRKRWLAAMELTYARSQSQRPAPLTDKRATAGSRGASARGSDADAV